MAKQGFGTRKETFAALTLLTIAIQLKSVGDRPRRIENIITSYCPTFAAGEIFAGGRVSVVRSLFDNPALQVASGPSGDLLPRLGEVLFDGFLSEAFTQIQFAGSGLRLLPGEDYTVILHAPVSSATYQDYTATTFPAAGFVGVLSVFGSEGEGENIFPVVR